MTGRCVEELLFHMPAVAQHTRDPWEQRFAQAMARLRNRRGWRPSPRQRETMERLVVELFGGPAGEVIEP